MTIMTFELNRKGGADILRRNATMQKIELDTMESILSIIKNQFFLQFGVQGNFRVDGFTTDRSTVKITAGDAITGAILKKNPKWLDQFIDNIKI